MTFKDRLEASPELFLLGALLTGFTAGVGAYKGVLEIAHLEVISKQELVALQAAPTGSLVPKAGPSAPAPTVQSELPETIASFPVELERVAGASELAATLRVLGYDASLMKDTETPQDAGSSENYPVISLGKEVPPGVAILPIRITHAQMPWVRYIFLQHEQPFAHHLILNAHKSWIPERGLRPLSDDDFGKLTSGTLSPVEFHAFVERFSG